MTGRYAQAGTPELTVETCYNKAARTFTIKASQSTPPTPGQPEKGPVPIPLAVGLLTSAGVELPLTLQVGAVQHSGVRQGLWCTCSVDGEGSFLQLDSLGSVTAG